MSSIIFAEDRIRLGKLRAGSRFLLGFHYLCKRSEAIRQSSRTSSHDCPRLSLSWKNGTEEFMLQQTIRSWIDQLLVYIGISADSARGIDQWVILAIIVAIGVGLDFLIRLLLLQVCLLYTSDAADE